MEEGITLAIRARTVLGGEQLQLQVCTAHLLHDREVLGIECLNLFRKGIVIRTLALLEFLVRRRLLAKMMRLGDCFHFP